MSKKNSRQYEAALFAQRWEGRGREKSDTQQFWMEFFQAVLGIKDTYDYCTFEKPVRVSGTYNGPKVRNRIDANQQQLDLPCKPSRKKVTEKSIDVYLPLAKTLVEQKSLGKDLDEVYKQSDDMWLTPFEQAYRYNSSLPFNEMARYIITSNFEEFRIYDLDYQEDLFNSGCTIVKLEELPDKLPLFDFLVREHEEQIKEDRELSSEAARLMAKLRDALAVEYELYDLPDHDLVKLMVRLLFCLYAEDAGLFPPMAFRNYLKDKEPGNATGEFRESLKKLFAILDTPDSERRMVPGELDIFPYVNGGLFSGEIAVPFFTPDTKYFLLQECSAFNWKKISPPLFGSLFETALDPKLRAANGMHYTSPENIRKATRPLFLDALKRDLARAGLNKRELERLRNKLASLKFLDPACGSGNFLTQTYMELREIENEALSRIVSLKQTAGQMAWAGEGRYSPKVNINQFYGIELNDFAVEVARVALQIANHQMDQKTSVILQEEIVSLPLTKQTNIVRANALKTDWGGVLPSEECSFVMGNPPFLGSKQCSDEQRAELAEVYGDIPGAGTSDYVSGWFVKAARYIAGTDTRCAFVSTNSICQGEQVANIWKPLADMGVQIDFAHDTFRWTNKADKVAHVFVIVIGFGNAGRKGMKALYHHADPDAVAETILCDNINAYLRPAPDLFVTNRSKPICAAPLIGIGNKPIDDGNYLFTESEKDEFLSLEPQAAELMHPWVGSREFLHGEKRWGLYLGDITPQQAKNLPLCMERARKVKEFRLKSKSAPTRKIANNPLHYHVENMPKGTSIVIPKVSSERREYIPMGLIEPGVLCSDLVFLVSDASLYHFGVIQSRPHNLWMKTIAGRLKSDYRYSSGIVYNNFPWPGAHVGGEEVPVEELVSKSQRQAVEIAAEKVLDARAKFPEATLAELYDPGSAFLFRELMNAHRSLDAAVEHAYGWKSGLSDDEITAAVVLLYCELAGK